METIDSRESMNKLYDNTTDFERCMYLINPNRGMKFSQFLSYISKSSGLRVKVLKATTNNNNHSFPFALAVDAYEDVVFKNEISKDSGKKEFIQKISDYLEEFKNNDNNDNIVFSKSNIDEIKNALKSTFKMELILETQSLKEKVNEVLN